MHQPIHEDEKLFSFFAEQIPRIMEIVFPSAEEKLLINKHRNMILVLIFDIMQACAATSLSISLHLSKQTSSNQSGSRLSAFVAHESCSNIFFSFFSDSATDFFPFFRRFCFCEKKYLNNFFNLQFSFRIVLHQMNILRLV